jgi:hypothetical protein
LIAVANCFLDCAALLLVDDLAALLYDIDALVLELRLVGGLQLGGATLLDVGAAFLIKLSLPNGVALFLLNVDTLLFCHSISLRYIDGLAFVSHCVAALLLQFCFVGSVDNGLMNSAALAVRHVLALLLVLSLEGCFAFLFRHLFALVFSDHITLLPCHTSTLFVDLCLVLSGTLFLFGSDTLFLVLCCTLFFCDGGALVLELWDVVVGALLLVQDVAALHIASGTNTFSNWVANLVGDRLANIITFRLVEAERTSRTRGPFQSADLAT